ncbi:MAG TPA: single-stranded-DNA-specific exonuclease RecJ [Bacteroidota bacterium]|nr:single-stranded-DNA-specific exonuclease RecJ [Bacteroidota bacterium]
MNAIREYRWKYRNSNGAASPVLADREALVKKLSDELTVSPVLTEILVNRGIDTFEKARAYFRPSVEDLHDPGLMDGMQVAVARIVRALSGREKIVVYGDYDVDGTNGASLIWDFLKKAGADARYFIPDRVREGYGLSNAGIEHAKKFGTTLLVAVDCGITAVKQVEFARSLGMDVIICDHHEPGHPLPDAVAVLDPLKPNCPYPYKFLCGCGVGFKLVQALCEDPLVRSRIGGDGEELLLSYLQYVTLATIADIVPLTQENRIIVKLGLELINTTPLPGIKALIESAGLRPGKVNAGQVVFVLAPRINAVGRLGDAMRAVELLTCDSYEKALPLAQVMEEENRNRRKIDEDTFARAQEYIDRNIDVEKNHAIVLHQDTWHPGVIGIVASRIVERYYRPTVLMTTIDGVAKGSARSISGFDIYQALKKCEDKLIQFGGHKYAAGLTVELDKIDQFREAFYRVANETLPKELLIPVINIDADIDVAELTPKFVRVLSQFAPFGPDNMRPVFSARNVELTGQPRIVGKNHLKFKVKKNSRTIDAVGFNLGDLLDRTVRGRAGLDVAFSLDENDFEGEMMPQLKIRDIKIASAEPSV